MFDDDADDAPVAVRWCPACDVEFQPQVQTCSDCGGRLEDSVEGAEHPRVAEREEDDAPPAPPEDWVSILGGLSGAESTEAADALSEAGIEFDITVKRRQGLDIVVSPADAPRAAAVLAAVGLAAPPIDPAAAVVGETGGPCPACGTVVAAGAEECPECGLVVGSADEPEGDAPEE